MPSMPYFALGLLCLLSAPWARAFPSYRFRVPNGNRVPCPDGAPGCTKGDPERDEPESVCYGLGHNTCQGGKMPLNLWGVEWKRAGKWTKALCEADADADGQTNGEELGDPCCRWSEGDEPSPYMASFTPSHPGLASSKQPSDYQKPCCNGLDKNMEPVVKAPGRGAFNPGEVQLSLEWRIKAYTIPNVHTAYVNVYFNIPDEEDLYHIVAGQALVDQPLLLHHYTFTGCSEKFDESLTGHVFPEFPGGVEQPEGARTCRLQIGGFSGWAPGMLDLFNLDKNSGLPVGRAIGIRSVKVNVHYTDGDKHPNTVTRDGMRIQYTTTPRKNVQISTPILQIGASDTMYVPKKKKRFFVTRTCRITDVCTDTPDEEMRQLMKGILGRELTCAMAAKAGLCPEDKEGYCKKACGKCRGFSKDEPLKLMATFYHAHLLGTEMYQELYRQEERCLTDLSSQPIWWFDDQAIFPLDGRKLTLAPGDIVQTTCVYNSMSRDEDTKMGLSTYQEMCFGNLFTEHVAEGLDLRVMPYAFGCERQGGDIWTGELEDGEDAKLIPFDHPLAAANVSWDSGWFGTGGEMKTGGLDEETKDFLKSIVAATELFDGNGDCALNATELEQLFFHYAKLGPVLCPKGCDKNGGVEPVGMLGAVRSLFGDTGKQSQDTAWYIVGVVTAAASVSTASEYQTIYRQLAANFTQTTCADGWVPTPSGNCFSGRHYIDSAHQDLITKAEAICAEYGAHLPVLLSESQVREFQLASGIPSLPGTDHTTHLGLWREGSIAEWEWVDGSSVNYTAWFPNQPTDKESHDRTCLLFSGHEAFGWYNVPAQLCGSVFYCQRRGQRPANSAEEDWTALVPPVEDAITRMREAVKTPTRCHADAGSIRPPPVEKGTRPPKCKQQPPKKTQPPQKCGGISSAAGGSTALGSVWLLAAAGLAVLGPAAVQRAP